MSKVKKNLIIIGSIVGVLVVLTIVFGSLFSIKKVNVDFLTTTIRLNEYSKEDILEEANIKKNKSIVFYDFDSAEENLEKAFPYAKFNIVRFFPSRVIIYVYERTPAFRVLQDGFWHIYDEELKCLEVIAVNNISINNNDNIPVLNDFDANFNVGSGEFLINPGLKNTISKILDGVYGFEATPISVMSDITLSTLDILETPVISLKLKESGTTIIVQGENLVKEKIAYALFVYASEVSQNSSYEGKLDKVSITVYQDFDLDNKQVVVNDGSN